MVIIFFFDLNVIRPFSARLPICSKNVENKNLFISRNLFIFRIFLSESYANAFGEGVLVMGTRG